MQLLGQMFATKISPNLETASRLLRSPLGQAVISFLLGYFATTKLSQIYGKIKEDAEKSGENTELDPEDDSELLPKGNEVVLLSVRQLTAFDGSSTDQPIYTALNGLIYDLSPGREKFHNHGPYSLLAGCNANRVLNIACSSMGVCADDVINRWEQSLKAEFNIVGYLIDEDMENNAGLLESDAESTILDETEQSDGIL
ncbi:neudesin [Drosophila elegans]|uniref:neudesin n=1 Tax=Drosophila elegans TaxID=30023 RepID=UPI0007E802C4|nr:neudesin [Drosophila elegans]